MKPTNITLKAWKDWLVSEGYNNSIPEAEHKFLTGEGYPEQLNLAWFKYLRGLGYGGSLPQLLQQLGNNFPPSSVPDLPVTNLLHHFDFSDNSTITITAGEISEIQDKVSLNSLLRKGPGNGPKISSINTVQSAVFDGADVLGAAIANSYFQGTDVPYTMSFVLESSQTGASFFMTLMGSTGDDYYGVGHNNTPGLYFSRKRDTSNNGNYVSGGSTSSSPHILTIVSDGTTVDIYLDGALVHSAPQDYNLMTNVTRINIGAFWSGGLTTLGNFIGNIGHILLYGINLDSSQLSDLHSNLSNKWSIAI